MARETHSLIEWHINWLLRGKYPNCSTWASDCSKSQASQTLRIVTAFPVMSTSVRLSVFTTSKPSSPSRMRLIFFIGRYSINVSPLIFPVDIPTWACRDAHQNRTNEAKRRIIFCILRGLNQNFIDN